MSPTARIARVTAQAAMAMMLVGVIHQARLVGRSTTGVVAAGETNRLTAATTQSQCMARWTPTRTRIS